MKGWKKKKLGNDRKVRKTAERSNVSRQSVRAGTLEQLDRHPVYLRRRNCGNRGDFSPCVPRGVEAAVKQRGKKERVGRRTGGNGSISFWLTRDVEIPRACKTLCSSKLVSPRGGRWIAEEEAREKREKSGIRVFSSSFVSGTIEAADGGSWKQPPRN